MKITLATNGHEIEKYLSTFKNCVDIVSMSLDSIGKKYDFLIHLRWHLYKKAITYPWVNGFLKMI